MTTEHLQYVAGLIVLVLVAVAFYLGGRDTGERRAYATVADLRHQLRVQKLDNDRLRDRLNTIPQGDARRVFGTGGSEHKPYTTIPKSGWTA